MKAIKGLVNVVLVVMLGILLPMQASAERIDHDGVKVEADGPVRDCLSCHDGALADAVSSCSVRCDFSTGHSLMKDYPPRGKEALYSPAAVVTAKGIKLVNGKVTCISCHNLRNPSRNHLVMDNTGSKLCLTCHIRM